jgi:hypothetical protein
LRIALAIPVSLLLAVLPARATHHPKARTGQQATSPTKAAPPPAAPAQAKIDPVKEKNIRHLLEVTGSKDLALQTMTNMEQAIRPMLTNAFPSGEYREKLIDLFLAKFHSKFSSDVIVDMAVPVYDKYFSDEEIKGLIQFYGTPLGKKTLETLPKLMSELQAQGQEWGQKAGRESMEEVLAEHPELAKAIDDAQKQKSPE